MRRPKIVNSIKMAMKPFGDYVQTIMFGSEARGDARRDSDIDLLLLVDTDYLNLSKEQELTMPLYNIEVETGVSINSVVMTKNQWNSRPFKTPFYINIINEGITL
ncbi:MAG: nucleotidyltransferase domain-containing protein [Paludibacteraceae bacterium]|nr:nucleotidyltransferase domain-containing protein [Paludibacteraceae bacterium]